MQFITHGPDIPDELLEAHEDGRVVFFCGAGVSYPAGLPGFKGLVEQIYERNGTVLSDIEKEVFERGQFDATLDLLERRLPGQRSAVRSALADVLKPKIRRKGATDTQEALLHLARNREGALRLVTTNFDRIFHVAANRIGQKFHEYAAPMLPIPKNSRWDGLVYLHGLLPAKVDDTSLNRLVVTSGDFGLAYLTERWAARFVSELFRNYVVCFVGYSINDPVLRYMMDALAADRMLGEITPQAWALGDCMEGEEQRKTIEWEAKGVTPILYNVPAGSHDHSALHSTLRVWADTYRDGVQGKEAIVVKHALTRPQDSTRQDNFVGRLLWALSDKSGLPAKRFADFNPAPSLDWLLESFTIECYEGKDLTRFGVYQYEEVNKKLRFSLIRRPAPYKYAPPMQLALNGFSSIQWDDVMTHLARWLIRHLDDPRLVIWIANRGGQLHERWQFLIERELDRFVSLERDGKTTELQEIIKNSPNAIPSNHMRILWRLLLSGRVKSQFNGPELYRWKSRLKSEGLSIMMRLELRELLAPKVLLKKPFRWRECNLDKTREVSDIKQLVDWELVLATDNVHSVLCESPDENWKLVLPLLLEDLQQLLRDALDLIQELSDADAYSDHSYWDLPSISPHWQNRGFHDWVSLIELLRDAWLACNDIDSSHAEQIAQNWFKLPYPTFKRLALFAASHDDCILSNQWVDWLLSDNAFWLWSIDTGREVFRLFVLQAYHLETDAQERLEEAILAGPPRTKYRADLEPNRWEELVARSVWLRLSKLSSSGCVLGEAAAMRLAEISTVYPHWQLSSNERDEFSHWMSGTGDPDFKNSHEVDIAPRKRQELVQWLQKQVSEPKFFYEDTWKDVCRRHLLNSLFALNDLADMDEWPIKRWQEAFQVWSDTGIVKRSWCFVAPIVLKMPDKILLELGHSVTWWIESASKLINLKEDIMLSLCRRVLSLPLEAVFGSLTNEDGGKNFDPVTSAINHPVGHVTQSLINLWFKQNPNDNELLSDELKPIFTLICDVRESKFRHGRVILGSRLIAFFRVDSTWTEQHLLPLFNWNNPVEAKAVWAGFLYSPRLYQPLLIAFKPHFLESVKHYSDLGENQQQFSAFLTYVALGLGEGYSVDEFRTAFAALPQEGLQESAQSLFQALEGAAEQREDYWKNRVQPLWQQVWPKSRDLASSKIAESLSRLAIAARGEFPAALAAVKDWLQAIEDPYFIVHLLNESGLCRRFPKDALVLLDALISEPRWAPRDLGQCLSSIVQSDPKLEQDASYKRLKEYLLRRSE